MITVHLMNGSTSAHTTTIDAMADVAGEIVVTESTTGNKFRAWDLERYAENVFLALSWRRV